METEDYEWDYEAESPPRPPPERESDAPRRERHDASTGSAPATPPRRRKRPLRADKHAVAVLTRKLAHYKKLNGELHGQLQKFYENEAIAFLENKAHERQQRIDALQEENKTLLHQQRVLTKQIEELQDAAENIPSKRIAQREELRVCREQLRHYKETHKVSEEKNAKMHQQIVDLTNSNKSLAEKVKSLESELTKASSPRSVSARSAAALGQQEAEAIIASQEEVITRLQHRVDVMKKAIKQERAKHEKESLTAQEELGKARADLEAFHALVFEKEKIIRSQFLEIKDLKRSLHEVIVLVQTNNVVHKVTGDRDVRFANHRLKRSPLKDNHRDAHELFTRLGLLAVRESSSVHLRGPDSTTTLASQPQAGGATEVTLRVPCPPPGETRPPRSSRPAHTIGHATSDTEKSSWKRSVGVAPPDNIPGELYYEDVDPFSFQPIAEADSFDRTADDISDGECA